ncbi:uncharacterized protein N0V96_004543 [Colletotrichum fioriniae]|uniref:uncharacterized protein n=1 Tax=Colletotrichum fioriniae TaxID=710243 RepID=UPI0032DBA4B3|nr:hypothetical protein N0V96_004543 [Colletotrichum fioriniae]
MNRIDAEKINFEIVQEGSKLNDSWESLADNGFAFQALTAIDQEQSGPLFTGKKIFCAKCSRASPQALYPAEFRPSEAQLDCDLCGILLDALKRVHNDTVLPETVKLYQTRTAVCVDGGTNLLSIYVEPGTQLSDIQNLH